MTEYIITVRTVSGLVPKAIEKVFENTFDCEVIAIEEADDDQQEN